MALTINSGFGMMNASLKINESQRMFSDALKKIVSGSMITSAADDPAGSAISQTMNARLMGLGTAVTNNETVANMARTAEASAGQISDLLGQARQIVVDSANTGVNDASTLQADQSRLNDILKSVGTLAGQAQFGTKNLFDGNLTLTANTGPDGQTVGVAVGEISQSALGTGATYTAEDGTVKPVDKFNNLGDLGNALASGDKNSIDQALGVIDKAISQVGEVRGKLGALESDVIGPINQSMTTAYQSMQESRSTISDADIAKEIAKVTQENIKSQVGAALTAQGKENAQNLMQLLL